MACLPIAPRPKPTSCGLVVLGPGDTVLVCHTTGTPRWDLPKGLQEPGETPREAAVREAWEETSLAVDPAWLLDLGPHDYLPAKRLHLFGLHVSAGALRLADCRCHTTYPHRTSGRPVPEVNDYAWKPRAQLAAWCGKNLVRVLGALDWAAIEALAPVARVPVTGGRP
jgi:8-oxo-dGTP pyrophosphatase MutT (NUDIX family)